MSNDLRDVTGFRGEKLAELALTEYAELSGPLFRPGFLGDKWPALDFYVELIGVQGKAPYFFAQTKSTLSSISRGSKNLHVSAKKGDIERLLRIPGPTYIIGVHEPTRRAFIRSVHTGVPVKAITRIPLEYELTIGNLQKLHNEVRDFWETTNHKPTVSLFA